MPGFVLFLQPEDAPAHLLRCVLFGKTMQDAHHAAKVVIIASPANQSSMIGAFGRAPGEWPVTSHEYRRVLGCIGEVFRVIVFAFHADIDGHDHFDVALT